ncbi:hypothetical protein [Mesobacillus zeae]|uniref:Uncharacterized protein n=1 Tax=Mesobacillus zeae TaxID=1917180 RepID=A0A398BEU1_9BACI|nr:hypothetical protein [Mesobacillus zeae]RID88869.1 hypothetical protein D1970_01110 [Mesobacillus zeae]
MKKFEYIFSFALLFVLTASLVMFRNDSDMTYLIIGVLVGAFSSITAFFFTKHNPNKPDE